MPAYETILHRLPASPAPLAAGRRAMLVFGAVPFEAPVTSWMTLRRSTEYRQPAQPRIPERPLHQYTGAGADDIDLDGVMFPGYASSGLGHLRALRALAEAGAPRLLMAGSGEVFGRYVITGIEESRTQPYPPGEPRRVAWRLRLARYGDDAPGGRLTELESSAAAVGDVRAVLDAAAAAVRAGATPAAVLAAAEAAADQA